MFWKTLLISAVLVIMVLVTLGWTPAAWLHARIPAPAAPPAPFSESRELGLQDRLLPLVRERRFEQAYSLAAREAPSLGLDPATTLCSAFERAGVRRDGALWLESWFTEHADVPGFANQALPAGVFVSEHLSPAAALRLLRPVVAAHPQEFGPAAALALAALQQAAQGSPGAEALALVDRAGALARTGEEHLLVQRMRADALALQGDTAGALAAHTSVPEGQSIARGERPEYCLQAAVLALQAGREGAASDWFEAAWTAWEDLEADHTERTLPVPDLALASRYALQGRPFQAAEVRQLDASRRSLADAGVQGQRALERLRRFPHLIQELQETDEAGLHRVISELDDTERSIGENAGHLRCLPYSLQVRPLSLALAHALRGEAFERLGQRERSLEHYRRALELFPQAPELRERVRRQTAGGPGPAAG